ncbi:MAG: eukaryotic-like serine/threonine-protein kinase [Blastocatellia bacterium]
MAKSFDCFNEAIAKDSNYALAYAGLVEAYFNLSFFASPVEVWTKAKSAALRALQIDGGLAEAHYAMALVSICYDRDWRTAEIEFKRAIELNPNYAPAHDWYAYSVLAQAGRFDEAFNELEKACELDPLSLAINTDYGNCLYWAGEYEQAIARLKKVIEMENQFFIAHMFLGLAYLKTGQFTEAISELELAQSQSQHPAAAGFLGYGYTVVGNEPAARRILDELIGQSETTFIPPDAIAMIYSGLGEKPQAFKWLQMACDKRTVVSLSLRVEPIFESLRADDEFADLLRRIGLDS